MPKESTAETEVTLSPEDKKERALIIKALWESLQEPAWTKDDLIDFGKAIFAKKTLKKMDDKTFVKIFPFLEATAVALIKRLQAAQAAQAAEETEAAENAEQEEAPAEGEESAEETPSSEEAEATK